MLRCFEALKQMRLSRLGAHEIDRRDDDTAAVAGVVELSCSCSSLGSLYVDSLAGGVGAVVVGMFVNVGVVGSPLLLVASSTVVCCR